MKRHDPVERVVAEALEQAGVRYVGENHPENTACLDFYLPDFDIFIEAKRMHSERTMKQMGKASDIILIQGMEAAKTFARLLKSAEVVR